MIQDSGGVFKVTAFDPNTVQKAYDTNPHQEVKVFSSIISIKPSDLNSKFIFTEEETIRAMMMVGATTDDLVKLSEIDKRKIPGTPQIQRKIIEELEERRLKTFETIVEARNNLFKKINKKKSEKENFKSSTSPTTKTTKNGYEKLKQKQLNFIMSYQKRKNDYLRSEEATTIRLNELKKTKEMEIQKKKLEEQKKLRIHVLKSIQKLNNNQNTEEINKRTEQIIKEKNQEYQKANDELRALKESLTKTPKKHQKDKIAQIEALESKISESKIILQRYHEQMQDNIEDIFLDQSIESTNSNAMLQFKKKEEMKLLMQREKEQFLNDQKMKLEKQLQEKEARIEANLKLISSQKMKCIRENKIILSKRSQSAAATKKLLEQQRIQKLQKSLKRQEEAIERAKTIKILKTNNLQEKAGENWIKQKYGANKAKKTSIQNRYKSIEKAEKTIERQEEIENIKNQAEIKKIKEFRTNTIKKVKLKEEYDDFKKTIMIDPDTNPDEIAKKYKVDMKSVKEMQNEINSCNINYNSKKH